MSEVTSYLVLGECREAMAAMPAESVDAVVTDPPYGLSKQPDMTDVLTHWLAGDDYLHNGSGFMGKSWDSFVPGPSYWREACRVLKPGGHMLVFGGSRTFDLLGLAIRLAGFEIRDTLTWLYGSGFPKSLDVSKAIDRMAGAEREVIGSKQVTRDLARNGRTGDEAISPVPVHGTTIDITAPATDAAKQWDGWGTALKPAYEPIILARKPFDGTVARNVLTHGTGAMNIAACRIPSSDVISGGGNTFNAWRSSEGRTDRPSSHGQSSSGHTNGRWPANVVLDEDAAELLDAMSGERGVSRFFYTSKASRAERNAGLAGMPERVGGGMVATAHGQLKDLRLGDDYERPIPKSANYHPTVKPLSLMRWLVKLVTPPGGVVLDPFMGSGTTGAAAQMEGMQFVGIDQDAEYCEIAERRIAYWKGVSECS